MENREKYFLFKEKLKKQSKSLFNVSIIILILHIITTLYFTKLLSRIPIFNILDFPLNYIVIETILPASIIFMLIIIPQLWAMIVRDSFMFLPVCIGSLIWFIESLNIKNL